MVYVERLERKGRTYYYLSKNFRVGKNKWKKIRRYIGETPPTKAVTEKVARDIEHEAENLNIIKKYSKYEFLADEDAEQLQDVKNVFKKWYGKIDEVSRNKYEEDFLVRFTYNSNAIEGNRLSLRETSMILTENIIPSGTSPNDYTEALNSKECLEFVKKYEGEFNKKFLLEVQKLITKNTNCRIVGSYRDSNVGITGSDWRPPQIENLEKEMTAFFQWYYHSKNKFHPVELASILHDKLVRTHPFTDGNGRTARMIMNWILHKNGFPMVYVETSDKINYYKAIEEGDRGNDSVFIHYIAKHTIKQHAFRSKSNK